MKIYKHKPHQGFQKGNTLSKNPSERVRVLMSEAKKKNPTRYWLGKKRPDLTGKNSSVWVNGNYKKSDRQYKDSAYIYWSKKIKKRDRQKCRLLSNECNGRIESHHILNWRDYPELRYLLTNGITLCAFHHPRKWEEEKRMIPIFQELLSVSKE